MAKKGDSSSVWESDSIPTLDLKLDVENPRIRVDPGATQEDIRLALLRTEKIDELAPGIARTSGLMAGERIIVTKEGGQFLKNVQKVMDHWRQVKVQRPCDPREMA